MADVTRSSLKELLGLEREPAALHWCTRIPKSLPRAEKKLRFCVKLDLATRGQGCYSTADEEECMGGAKYCGLRDAGSFAPGRRSGEFLVARGIYRSVAAVQRSWQNSPLIEPGIFKALAFAPLSDAPFDPDVVFVLCTAQQGMQLLHANAYDAGASAVGADAGPICSRLAAVPYLTGKVSYGFGDVGARQYMGLGSEGVMVSIPGSELSRVVSNLTEMRGKKAFLA
ncbi:MAG: DUF169 domain-containing protein [Polyangiaceae bacterium]|nr:DUF169 domain-containing protein [Polyangiaceae bacterium]